MTVKNLWGTLFIVLMSLLVSSCYENKSTGKLYSIVFVGCATDKVNLSSVVPFFLLREDKDSFTIMDDHRNQMILDKKVCKYSKTGAEAQLKL